MFTPEQAGINCPPSTSTSQPAMPPLRLLDKLAMALLLASGFNSGLVGAFDLDLLGWLAGAPPAATETLRVAIGLAAIDALVLAWQWRRHSHA